MSLFGLSKLNFDAMLLLLALPTRSNVLQAFNFALNW
jgi:hypothetical protein